MGRPFRDLLESTIALLYEPGFVPALTTWPTFSITSFLMASRLERIGLRPLTILDVGANIGQFATAVAKVFPDSEVHSYEPVPECYGKLQKLSAKLTNLRTYGVALGDSDGEIELNLNSHSHSSSVLPLAPEHERAFPFAKEIGKIVVKLRTLDEACSEIVLRAPVLLKLDVQGYEPNVVRGAAKTLPSIDYVLVEVSFAPLYLGESTFRTLFQLLETHGFEFLQPVGFLTDPVSRKYLQMDALFVRRGANGSSGALR